MDPSADKRKIVRHDFRQTIHLQATREREGKLEFLESVSRGVDINSHGLGLVTDIALQAGDVVRAQVLVLPEGTFLPVFSRVVWSGSKNKEFRVGLQFLY